MNLTTREWVVLVAVVLQVIAVCFQVFFTRMARKNYDEIEILQDDFKRRLTRLERENPTGRKD